MDPVAGWSAVNLAMVPFPAQRTGVYRNIKLEELVNAKVGRFVLYATEWHRMNII